MNWQTKALIQKVISKLPLSGRINYFLQRYVSRNMPMSEEVFEQKKEAAKKHLQAYIVHHETLPRGTEAYEFGGGYDLAVPILLAQYGITKQVVTDINPLLKKELVNDVLERLGITGSPAKLGIEYKVPVDAKHTGFDNNRFHFIHSTDTLEHIPKEDILPILQECYRILKPGGVISCIIDLQDHYAYFDPNLSKFNFYTFSKKDWEKRYNNPLQYQNRLLADEYYSFFKKAGFAPINMELTKADEAETKKLKDIKLHIDFAREPDEKLNNLRCYITAEKPD